MSQPCSRRIIKVNACFWWLNCSLATSLKIAHGDIYRNNEVVTIEGGSVSGRGVCFSINCVNKSGLTPTLSISIFGCMRVKKSVMTTSSPCDIICGFLYKTVRSQSMGSWRWTRCFDKCWPTISARATVPYIIAFRRHTRVIFPFRLLRI